MNKFKYKSKNEKINIVFGLLANLFIILSLVFGFIAIIDSKIPKQAEIKTQPVSNYLDNIKDKLKNTTVLKPIEGTDSNVLAMLRKIIDKKESDLNIEVVKSSNAQISRDGTIIYGNSKFDTAIDITVEFIKDKKSFIKDISVFLSKKTTKPIFTERSVKVSDYGTVGDGIMDDTLAFQKAINYISQTGGGTVNVKPGTYLINPDISINMKNNVQLSLSDDAVLKASASSKSNSEVINIINVSNVNVIGGKIIGDRMIHIGTTGEWGMGINVEGGSNVSIAGIEITNCWGDGIYLGGDLPANDIKINSVISDNNRRQGLSITNAKNVNISNSEFKNTNGTLPMAGIDIEPNPNQSVDNVVINNIKSINNKGSGIDILGTHGPVSRISIINSTFKDNSGIGIMMSRTNNLTFDNDIVMDSIFGVEIRNDINNVTLTNMTISNNQSRGVSLVSSGQTIGIENIIFKDSTISNNSQDNPGDTDGVRIDNYDSTGYIKNIKFMNTKFIDNQSTHTQKFGLTVGNSKSISDISIYADCIFSGNIAGNLYTAIPISQNVPR